MPAKKEDRMMVYEPTGEVFPFRPYWDRQKKVGIRIVSRDTGMALLRRQSRIRETGEDYIPKYDIESMSKEDIKRIALEKYGVKLPAQATKDYLVGKLAELEELSQKKEAEEEAIGQRQPTEIKLTGEESGET